MPCCTHRAYASSTCWTGSVDVSPSSWKSPKAVDEGSWAVGLSDDSHLATWSIRGPFHGRLRTVCCQVADPVVAADPAAIEGPRPDAGTVVVVVVVVVELVVVGGDAVTAVDDVLVGGTGVRAVGAAAAAREPPTIDREEDRQSRCVRA